MIFYNQYIRCFQLICSCCLLLSFFSSCVPTKSIIYLQDKKAIKTANKEIPITAPLYSYTISAGDLVGVEISTFNKNGINSITDGLNTKQGTDPLANGYLVDSNGNVYLPLIGTVQVVGLSIPKAQEVIATKA
ncbi:MAG: polysaccharide biosynthesis/export family protein, partial [Flammeovirgaceae bacterium]